MTAMTASVAGVKEITIFMASICDEIIYAGTLCGVSEYYEIGGAQAIAAAAFGTESVKPVDMIVGYVTLIGFNV
jgi:histidinol dehydrogenase